MIFFEYIRNIGFWCLDALKGNPIKNHKNEIKYILENYQSDKSKQLRDSYLKNILNHAIHTVPYYKTLELKTTIEEFPVLDKLDLRKNFGTLQSERLYKKKFQVTSSGSSGIISIVNQNKNKKDRNTADTIYFKRKAGFKVGHRLYYLRKWFEIHKKSPIKAWLQNIKKIEVTKFNDTYLAKILKDLETDQSNKMIIGYASALRDLCNYLDKTNTIPKITNISCVIAMSESLGDTTRASLNKHFKTSILSRYSNLENGLFAMQLPGQGEHYHINWASYFIELLHLTENKPAKKGELGRIVITDLFNYAMPIIRYDTGDLAYLLEENHTFNKAPVFIKIEGRKMDMIRDTKGQPVSSFIVFHLEPYPQIQQFQLIQTKEKDYIIQLVIEGKFKKDTELISLYKKYLGEDANIIIKRVSSIPHLASGKRRLTINQIEIAVKPF